eukprot:Hpha_TRINITY_DN27643_c0_g1::TRINITY_DN27643_c0_g1_i1::g.57323::m.57323
MHWLRALAIVVSLNVAVLLVVVAVGYRPGDDASSPQSAEQTVQQLSATVVRNRLAAETGGSTGHWEKETIFIGLGSYGDGECGPTIQRAFARAAVPERVFFGVFQQHNCTGRGDSGAEECKDCVAELWHKAGCPGAEVCSRLWQVRVRRVDMSRTEGVTVARYEAESMFRGETYALGLDAHSHFARGWDSLLISTWRTVGDDMAVLTSYPAVYGQTFMGYDVEQRFALDIAPPKVPVICATRRAPVLATSTFKHVMSTATRPKRPVRAAFLAAGFNFARGHRIARVPYDPYTPYLFDGEEISMGVRLWTHGYDLFVPNITVVAHLYIPGGSKLRPVFWTEDWNRRARMQEQSAFRINSLLGVLPVINPGDARSVDTREAARFGVGAVRPAAAFWEWAGVTLGDQKASKDICPALLAGGMPLYPRDMSALYPV